MLAHGALLRKNFFSNEELAAIYKDFHHAGLPEEEVALMAFAQQVVLHPGIMDEKDFDGLRAFGYSDVEILNVVLVATARSFFSKTLDALGAEPDEAYKDLDPELLRLFTGIRPIPWITE